VRDVSFGFPGDELSNDRAGKTGGHDVYPCVSGCKAFQYSFYGLCAATLVACGVEGDGRSEGGGSGILTAGVDTDRLDEETGGSDGGESGGGQGGTDADDGEDDGGGDGVKFDLPPTPDGEPSCGEAQEAFSYIWIANSSQGTVSKIDTKTGIEEGRYRTAPGGSESPSRTSVNQYGDVAVGNRNGSGRITKIAATLDRCVEKNGIPGIQTSSGPDDILAWDEDECVLWSTPVAISSNGPRAIAWEGGELDPVTCQNTVPNPRLWVGWDTSPQRLVRLDGETGGVLDDVNVGNASGRIYGGGVDGSGNMWMVNRGANQLIRVDALSLAVQNWAIPGVPYGMGVDANGDPWINTYSGGAGNDRVWRFDTALEEFVDTGSGGGYYRGMNLDREGRAWIAGNQPCRLGVWDAVNDAMIDDSIALPGCGTPVGVSIDHDGFVWVVDQNGTAYKIDPDTHQVALTVTGLTGPYTYSDMTGAGLNLVVNPPG
jgi:hypothetical protein